MSTNKFDVNRPVQTRDGRKARIICTDRKQSDYPIVAVIGEWEEELHSFRADGKRQLSESGIDLINIPAQFEFERWVNVYPHDMAVHSSQEEAGRFALTNRIACIRVVIKGKEGDGL